MGLAAKMAAAYNPPGECSPGTYYGEPAPQPNSIPTSYKQLLKAITQEERLQSIYPPIAPILDQIGQQTPPQGKYPPASGWYFPQYYGTPPPQQAYGSPPQQEYGLPLPRAPYSRGTLPSSASHYTVHDVVADVEAMKGFGIDEKRFIVLVDKDRVQTNPNRAEDGQRYEEMEFYLEKEERKHFKKRFLEAAFRDSFSAYYKSGEAMNGIGAGEVILDDLLTGRISADMNFMEEKIQDLFLQSLEADLKSKASSGTEHMYGMANPGVNRDLTPPITMATLKVAIEDQGNNANPNEDLYLSTLRESFLNTSNRLGLSSMSTLSKLLTSLTSRVSGPSAVLLAFVVPAGAVAIPGEPQEIQSDWKERILDLLTGDLVGLTEMVVPAILTVTSGFIAAKFLEKGRRGMCALFMLVSGVVFVTIRSPQHSDDDDQVRLLHAAVGLSYAFFTTVYCSLVVKKDDWSKGWTASAAGAAVLGTWVLMSIPSVSSYWKELTSLPSAFALAIGAPLSFAVCEVVNYLTGPRSHGAGNQSHPLQNGMQNRPIGDRDDYDSRGFYPSVAYGFA